MAGEVLGGVVVAACGAGAAFFSWMQSRRAGDTAEDVQRQVGPAITPGGELVISPALHTEYLERVAIEVQRRSRLEELLRLSMRIVRRQNRRLTQAGLESEPILDELIPYSIG